MMKKLAALVLALILALAVTAALGEDFSGSWYLNTAGVTAGTVELNADGTAVYSMGTGDDAESYNGTWVATETGVDLTVEGATLPLTANEKGLANEDEALYLTREPEKINLDQLQAYFIAMLSGETPEIPEGVTEEEMAAALAALLGEDETEGAEELPGMTYEEYAAAANDDEVNVYAYVQATQSWWNDKITVYAQTKDGAYFIYELACSEEDAAKLVPGTPILVTGYKGEWGGEVEIMNATFEFADGEPYIAEAEDVTDKIGTDELINEMNKKVVFKGLTVEKYAPKDGEAIDGAIKYKDDKVGEDDIYFQASKDGKVINFCVEFYLTNADTEVYKAVEALNVGDVVDIEAFLYWYEGANPHVISVTPAQ